MWQVLQGLTDLYWLSHTLVNALSYPHRLTSSTEEGLCAVATGVRSWALLTVVQWPSPLQHEFGFFPSPHLERKKSSRSAQRHDPFRHHSSVPQVPCAWTGTWAS